MAGDTLVPLHDDHAPLDVQNHNCSPNAHQRHHHSDPTATESCSADHNHSHQHHPSHETHQSCGHNHSGWRQYLPHSHSLETRLRSDTTSLQIAFAVLCSTFLLQLIVAFISRSSALMGEAIHTALDGLTVIISLVSVLVSQRKAPVHFSYGYARAEVLSALVSVIALSLLCAKVFATGVRRLWQSPGETQIHVNGLQVMAAEGVTLISNASMACILARSGGTRSLNVRALQAHVIADCVENIFVLIGGVLIWRFPSANYIDPLLAILIVIAIVSMNYGICRETVATLMQAAPPEKFEQIARDVATVKGVIETRRLHIWTVTSGCLVGSIELVAVNNVNGRRMRKDVKGVFVLHGVEDVIVQISEHDECDDEQESISEESLVSAREPNAYEPVPSGENDII